MSATDPSSSYALGYTDAEHERLIRQAALLAPLTERLFREAGIGAGQRVLDLGSGVGDVSMLVARIVGPSGEVVGIERDAHSVDRARARVTAAGLGNLHFVQTDAGDVSTDKPFDAAVGRFILMFLPDPAGAVRSVARLVRPGGVLAFLEPTWKPFLALTPELPLRSATASLTHEILRLAGGNTEMGMELHRLFREVGLPAPTMSLAMPLGDDSPTRRWIVDVLSTLRPRAPELGLSLETLGDLETLASRLDAESKAADSVVGGPALVGAWARRPAD